MDNDLVARIPENGTLEWAEYVQNNYSTEYFKPVDLFRAGMIVERNRINKLINQDRTSL